MLIFMFFVLRSDQLDVLKSEGKYINSFRARVLRLKSILSLTGIIPQMINMGHYYEDFYTFVVITELKS